MRITDVYNRGLCMGCGICRAVCPAGCIEIDDFTGPGRPHPILATEACRECGRCLEACPGAYTSLPSVARGAVTASGQLLGPVEACYIVDGAQRFKTRYTASGGFVPALLAYLMETDQIDGAVTVRARTGTPHRGCSIVSRSAGDLLECAGSLYYPVSLHEALETVSRQPGRYALVGLPCQIQGIGSLKHVRPRIGERIVLTIGLFCGFMPGFSLTDYLLHILGVSSPRRCQRIAFRARSGSADGFLVQVEDREFFLSRSRYASLVSSLFSETRCLSCSLMTNEHADISCGDAGPCREGYSLVIARKAWCSDLILKATARGYMHSRSTPTATVYRSQRSMLSYKKGTAGARVRLLRLARRVTPQVDVQSHPPCDLRQWIGVGLYLANVFLLKSRPGRLLLWHVPVRLVRSYNQFVTRLLVGGFRHLEIDRP